MTKPSTLGLEQGMSLEQRREFLKLSLEERRRLMAEQASRMIQDYEAAAATEERAQWQGGDLVELS